MDRGFPNARGREATHSEKLRHTQPCAPMRGIWHAFILLILAARQQINHLHRRVRTYLEGNREGVTNTAMGGFQLLSGGLLVLIAISSIEAAGQPQSRSFLSKIVTACGPSPSPGHVVGLYSPGYSSGEGYEHNTQCEWNITVTGSSHNTNMMIRIQHIDLESHYSCAYDYVLIFDRQTNVQLGKFCGDMCSGTTIVVPSREARVVFRSDQSEAGRGFHFHAWAVSPSYEAGVSCYGGGATEGCLTCGGPRTSSSGVIESLYYDDPGLDYPTSLMCLWEVTPWSGQHIRFSFESLGIESHSNCIWDSVRIYQQGHDNPLAVVCGDECLPSITVPASSALVTFTSDYSVTGNGFRLRYDIIDPASASGLTCNCPSDGRGCLSGSNSDTDRNPALPFTTPPTVNTPPPTTTPTTTTTTTSATTTTITTTTTTPTPPNSNDDNLGSSLCGGVLTYPTGTIQTPNYPQNYGNRQDCEWEIWAQNNQIIVISRQAFTLEYQNYCNYDYVTFYHGTTSQHTGFDTYCGSMYSTHGMPATWTSSSNVVTVKFNSDSSVTHTGFRVTYSMQNTPTNGGVPSDDGDGEGDDSNTVCGSYLTDPVGVIASPNYPSDYGNQQSCTWTIQVESGKAVQLQKQAFELENHNNCHYDSLSFYYGTPEVHGLVGKYCGTYFPPTLTSSGNVLTLRFTSDSSVTESGFYFTYSTVDVSTGGDSGDDEPEVECGVVPQTRIVGGSEAAPHSLPWNIALFLSSSAICGGTIVDNDWVLTAAHCIISMNPGSYHIEAGIHVGSESSRQRRDIQTIIKHNGFNSVTLENDIALLRLSSSLTWTREVIPACVPTLDPPVGTDCKISGWGLNENDRFEDALAVADLPILDNNQCNQNYQNANHYIYSNMMCAGYFSGGVDTCQGDSGGPLQCISNGRYSVHGITSWGVGCGLESYPGVYTRVSRYRSWIQTASNNDIEFV